MKCEKCRGRHHVTICSRRCRQDSGVTTPSQGAQGRTSSGPNNATPTTTNAFCADTQTPVLLQTAQLKLYDPRTSRQHTATARAVMDSGSQRTYITCRLRYELCLPTLRTESLHIKTFGSAEGYESSCDIIQLALKTKNHGSLRITALVVPVICNPLTIQPISRSQECYDHLVGLELADSADCSDALEVDVLIGSDWYWSLATGRIMRTQRY